MLLTAFVLVIAFVALSGMVARVTQLPSETRQSAERPIFTESRAIASSLEEILNTTLVGLHGAEDGVDIDTISYEFNAAVRHLDTLQSSRGFHFDASPLVCTDKEPYADPVDPTNTNRTIRLWMDFTIRNVDTSITRSVSVEIDDVGWPGMMISPCPDAGFPFEDANGDLLYRAADGDVALNAADVTDGSHTVPAGSGRGIVIPESVGDIFASSVGFRAEGPSWFGVDITATGPLATDDVILQTSSGDLWLAGDHEYTARGSAADVQLGSPDGVHIEWAILTADTDSRGSTADECVGLLSGFDTSTLYVEGATVVAGTTGTNVMNVPSTVRVVGTFASGSAGTSCTN